MFKLFVFYENLTFGGGRIMEQTYNFLSKTSAKKISKFQHAKI